MLKKVFISLIAIGICSFLILSCKKTSSLSNTANTNVHAPSKLLKAILNMGIKIEVTYQDGCYHSHEEYYSNGNIKTRDISCEGTCKFCKVEGVTQVNLVTNDNGNTGLPVPISTQDNFFYGMVGTTANGSGLVFAVDRTKISQAAYTRYFNDDFLILANGYMLDDKAYEMLHITREQQIIPAGTYRLNQDGDLIWWFVSNEQ